VTFTYNSTGLSSDTTSQVRLLIRDNSSGSYEFEDEELDWLVSDNPNVYYAAAVACETLASKYSSYANKQVGDLKISYRNQSAEYLSLARALRRKGAISAFTPYAGGISVSDKDSYEADTNRVVPAFRRDLHQHGSYTTST